MRVREPPWVDFALYAVAKTSHQIAAQYVVRDGPHSEILASLEVSAGIIAQSAPAALDGGLVYAQFDNDLLTAMAIHSQTAGVVTLWTYPETMDELLAAGSALPDPGLGSPGSLAALDALVSAHLSGPAAAAALDSYHAAVDQYFPLSVPEPASVAMAALAAAGVAGGVRPKRERPARSGTALAGAIESPRSRGG